MAHLKNPLFVLCSLLFWLPGTLMLGGEIEFFNLRNLLNQDQPIHENGKINQISNTPTPLPVPTSENEDQLLTAPPSNFTTSIINTTNVNRIQLLSSSSTNNNSVVLGKESLRWGVLANDGLEFHEVGSNNLIWKIPTPELLPYIYPNSNGDQVFGYDVDTYQIYSENQPTQKFGMPQINGKDEGELRIFANFKNKLICVEIQTPFFYVGPQIPLIVFKWGETKPIYSLEGFNATFSNNEDYLMFQSGKNLIISDAKSGSTITEIFLNNEWASWKTSWDDRNFAISRMGTVEIWQIADKKLIRTIQVDSDQPDVNLDFVFSPNSENILALNPGRSLSTWSVADGSLLNKEISSILDLRKTSVTDTGTIIQHDLPQIRGSNWENPFDTYSNLFFSGEDKKLLFSIGLVSPNVDNKEICEWDLITSTKCKNDRFWTWEYPGRAKIIGTGESGRQYFIKPYATTMDFGIGWGKEEKVINSLPKISTNVGYLRSFSIYDKSQIILLQYSAFPIEYQNSSEEDTFSENAKSVFIINRTTNARLLLSGRINRFALSPDGNVFYELAKSETQPGDLEFVQYDAKKFTVNSRKAIKKPDENSLNEDKFPEVSAIKLSNDGNALYAIVNYPDGNTSFLSIPISNPEKTMQSDLGLRSDYSSNFVLSENGDLGIFAQNSAGLICFIDLQNGKLLKTIKTEGYPVQIALQPGGEIIAVAERSTGIKLFGLPENNKLSLSR